MGRLQPARRQTAWRLEVVVIVIVVVGVSLCLSLFFLSLSTQPVEADVVHLESGSV